MKPAPQGWVILTRKKVGDFQAQNDTGSAISLAALMVLVGWAAGIENLKSLAPGWPTMKVNTAIAFALAGLAFVVEALSQRCGGARGSAWILIRKALSGVVLSIGVITLLEYLFSWDAGIDQLLFRDSPVLQHPGRMAPLTALSFICIGSSVVCLHSRTRRGGRPAEWLVALPATVAFFGVMDYLIEPGAVYTRMALHTGVLLFALSTLVLLCHGGAGFGAVVFSNASGGVMARRVLPVVIMVPIALAVARYTGQQKGLFGEWFGISLGTLVAVFLPTAVVLHTAGVINRQEANLAEREQQLAALFNTISDYGLFSLAADGKVVAWNAGAERLTGYSSHEALGRHISFLYAEGDRGFLEIAAELEEADRTGRAEREGTRWRKDGSTYLTHTITWPVRGPVNELRGFVKVSRDITEWKKVQLELERARRDAEAATARLNAVVEGSSDMIAAVDMECRLMVCNATYIGAFRRYLGHDVKPGDCLVEKLSANPDQQSLVLGLWRRALAGEEFAEELEVSGAGNPGHPVWHDVRLSIVRDSAGVQIGASMIVRDVTERKRSENDLRRVAEELAKSNSELEQFAYVASHDLQEPLRAVGGCIQIVRNRYADKLDSRGVELIGHVVDGVSRMQTLINDLLAFSRVSTRGKAPQVIESQCAIEAALKNLQQSLTESGGTVHYNGLPAVCADDTQLTQLFQNLIGNALKYRRGTPVINVSASVDGETTRFTVADNGIGIAPEYYERIFGIFQRLHTRREYPGTGIGLAICKKIVERHGGQIWVKSEVGHGSTFHFTVPNNRMAAQT